MNTKPKPPKDVPRVLKTPPVEVYEEDYREDDGPAFLKWLEPAFWGLVCVVVAALTFCGLCVYWSIDLPGMSARF